MARTTLWRAGATALGGRTASILAGFLLTLIVARDAGAVVLGQFLLVVAVLVPLAVLSRLGSGEPMIARVAGDGPGRARAPAAGLVVSVVGAGVASVAMVLTAVTGVGPLARLSTLELVLALSWFVLGVVVSFLSDVLRAAGEIGRAVAISDVGVSWVAIVGVVVVAVRGPMGLPSLLAAHVVGGAVVAVCGAVLAASAVDWRRPTSDDVRGLASLSKYVAVAEFATMAWPHGVVLVVGGLAGDADAGVMGTVLRVASVVTLPLVAGNLASSRALAAGLASGDREAVEHLGRSVATVAAMAALPAAAVMVGWPAGILRGAFGEPFAVGATALQVVAVAQLVNVALGPPGLLLVLSSRARAATVGVVAGGAVAVAGSVVGAPMGLTAVGVAVGAGIVVQNVVNAGQVQRLVGVRTWTRADVRDAVATLRAAST